ncbi:MAG: hypothetical protein ACREJ9_02115 [Candidatus Rokuibacteriota bacterium]
MSQKVLAIALGMMLMAVGSAHAAGSDQIDVQAPRSDRSEEIQAPRGDRLDEVQAPRGERPEEIQAPRGAHSAD